MRTTCSFFAQRLDGRTVAAAANAAAPAPSTLALAPTPLAGTEDATAAGAVVTAFNFVGATNAGANMVAAAPAATAAVARWEREVGMMEGGKGH